MSAEIWMRRALDLASRGEGLVEPNPMVGAVIVRDGAIVGEGWHQKYGEPHAEIHALRAAGNLAHGATLYVTLEPCCHHGKTPPCTDAVIASGLGRVVAAMSDPFPQVAGGGLEQLRKAGIVVEAGLLEAEARQLNAPYLKRLTTGCPWVIAKWAMTLDGKTATRTGDSKWISGGASRRRVHELRGRMDGIIAGIGTVLADDPQLTVRPPGARVPTRIVLDSRGRIPVGCNLVTTAREVPTVVATTAHTPGEKRHVLEAAGCEVLILPEVGGRVCPRSLLQELGRRRMTNVLIEGGGEVLGAFRDERLIDEVWGFVAPVIFGGTAARSPVGGTGVTTVSEAWRLKNTVTEILDGDVLVRGRVMG